MEADDIIEYWPGTGVRKSFGNGFTHGYLGSLVRYDPNSPIRSKPAPKTSRAGFHDNKGTLHGMGPKQHQTYTIKAKKS